jgi:Protein of unknown function (DUF3142)
MMRFAVYLRRGAVSLAVAALCLGMLGDRPVQAAAARMAFANAMPGTVLWAWEEPEDLRGAEAQSVGVAYLAETAFLGDALVLRHRHQPLAVAPNAAVMAVVRIETQPDFRDSLALRKQTANALAEVSRRPGLRALQVDFDATRSEREFYTGVLRQLRPQMPIGMPLSITALLSWCGDTDDWMAGLPIDEAVPMFFRLGGHARSYDDKDSLTVREPLCRTSIGLSTDESWPATTQSAAQATTRRIYLFSPQSWRPEQLLAAASVARGERDAVLRVRDDPASRSIGINDTGLRPRGHTPEIQEDQP